MLWGLNTGREQKVILPDPVGRDAVPLNVPDPGFTRSAAGLPVVVFRLKTPLAHAGLIGTLGQAEVQHPGVQGGQVFQISAEAPVGGAALAKPRLANEH